MAKYSLEDIGTWIQNTTGMTDEQAQTAKTIAQFFPILGTGIDIYDAINNPTAENIGWAALSSLTDIVGGRIIAKGVKAAKEANKANKAIRAMSDTEKAIKLRHAQQEAIRLTENRTMSQLGRPATETEKYVAGIYAKRNLENEWQQATKQIVYRGKKYNKHPILVNRHTSVLDPYYIQGLGYVFGDIGSNSIQQAVQHNK